MALGSGVVVLVGETAVAGGGVAALGVGLVMIVVGETSEAESARFVAVGGIDTLVGGCSGGTLQATVNRSAIQKQK